MAHISVGKMIPDNVFVDTVCWIALLNKNEYIHKQADTEYRKLLKKGCHLFTTTAVLNETANSLCSPHFRNSVLKFYSRISASENIRIVFVDEQLWNKGWEIYEKHNDKEWSLTDCISVKVMQEHNISEVLTTDHHFEQAGFVRLLHH